MKGEVEERGACSASSRLQTCCGTSSAMALYRSEKNPPKKSTNPSLNNSRSLSRRDHKSRRLPKWYKRVCIVPTNGVGFLWSPFRSASGPWRSLRSWWPSLKSHGGEGLMVARGRAHGLVGWPGWGLECEGAIRRQLGLART